MNKGIRKTLGIAFVMALAFSACELLGDCKTCQLVSSTGGIGPGILYCGDELAEKEAYSQDIGGVITYYDCK